MTSPDGLAVLALHDAAQESILARGVAGAGLIFSEVLDPLRLDETTADYVALASTFAEEVRTESAAAAVEFYGALRLVEDADGTYTPRPPSLAPTEAVQTSLAVVGPYRLRAAMSRGDGLQEATRKALRSTVGAVTRITEAGNRGAMMQNAYDDPASGRYARRSGGAPCDFCAMLISRGPVYRSEDSGDFKAHDHCHCRAVPVFGTDDGWTTQARTYRALWDSSGGDRATFRAALSPAAPAALPAAA